MPDFDNRKLLVIKDLIGFILDRFDKAAGMQPCHILKLHWDSSFRRDCDHPCHYPRPIFRISERRR